MSELTGGLLTILSEARRSAAAAQIVHPSLGLSILCEYLEESEAWAQRVIAWIADGRSRRDGFEDDLVERYRDGMPALRESAEYHYLRAEWERSL